MTKRNPSLEVEFERSKGDPHLSNNGECSSAMEACAVGKLGCELAICRPLPHELVTVTVGYSPSPHGVPHLEAQHDTPTD
jgi:hypothetical protein